MTKKNKTEKLAEASRILGLDIEKIWLEVKRERLAQGKSQSYMAESIGVSQGTYARYESLEFLGITKSMIKSIEKALGFPEGRLEIPPDIPELSNIHGRDVASWLRDETSIPYIRVAYQNYLVDKVNKP